MCHSRRQGTPWNGKRPSPEERKYPLLWRGSCWPAFLLVGPLTLLVREERVRSFSCRGSGAATERGPARGGSRSQAATARRAATRRRPCPKLPKPDVDQLAIKRRQRFRTLVAPCATTPLAV